MTKLKIFACFLLLLCSVPAFASVSVNVADAGFYFSPGNWYISGTSYALTPSAGAYFYFRGTFTDATMGLDTSALGSNPLIMRCSLDGSAWSDSDIQGLSSIQLVGSAANTDHTVTCVYRGRTGIDSWNTPSDGWKITGLTLNTGATTTAPAVKPCKMLILGDSRVEGRNLLSIGEAAAQDATLAIPFMIGSAYRCEIGVVAYAALGWGSIGVTNVPPLFTPSDDTNSSWNKIFSGHSRTFGTAYDYIVELDIGGADYNNSVSDATVTASVAGFLPALRAAAPSAKIIVVLSYDGKKNSAITAGYVAYQNSTPDRNATLVDPALSATEVALIFGPTCGTANLLTTDCVHPNTYGQSQIGSKVLQRMQVWLALMRILIAN